MPRAHNERQAVGVDRNRSEMLRIGPERDHAQLKRAQVQLRGNPRGQHPVHRHAHMRKLPPEAVDGRQQVHARVLVGRQLQMPALQALQLVERARLPRAAAPAGAAHSRAAARPPRSATHPAPRGQTAARPPPLPACGSPGSPPAASDAAAPPPAKSSSPPPPPKMFPADSVPCVPQCSVMSG
jgi:hypothetical protein